MGRSGFEDGCKLFHWDLLCPLKKWSPVRGSAFGLVRYDLMLNDCVIKTGSGSGVAGFRIRSVAAASDLETQFPGQLRQLILF